LSEDFSLYLKQYSNLDRFEQKNSVDTLIKKWVEANEFEDFVTRFESVELSSGREIEFEYFNQKGELVDVESDNYTSLLDDEALDYTLKLKQLEAINNIEILNVEEVRTTDNNDGTDTVILAIENDGNIFNREFIVNHGDPVKLSNLVIEEILDSYGSRSNRQNGVLEAYDKLTKSVYNIVLKETVLKNYTDTITVSNISADDVTWSFTEMNQLLLRAVKNSPEEGIADYILLREVLGSELSYTDWGTDDAFTTKILQIYRDQQ
jgi:hypothetical protein